MRSHRSRVPLELAEALELADEKKVADAASNRDTAMSRRIDAAIAVGVAAAAAALFLWRTRRARARTSSLRVHSFRPPKVAVGALLSPSVTLTVGDAAPADTDILLLFLEGVSNSDAMAAKLAALPNLRAVIIPFAGPTEPMRTALASEVERRAREGLPKLPLLNSHHNAPMTAEMAVALLLACAKRLLPADAALRRGDWSARGLPLPGGPRPPPPPLPQLALDGRRVVVVGLGAVGKRVAAACAALGMKVHATSRSAARVHEVELKGVRVTVHPASTLLSVLADPAVAALMLCAPDTPETRGMVGAAELAALPDDAVVVNVGRGSLVQPAPLKAALEAGALAGYGSDVWWQYPKAFAEVTSTPPWADDATSLAALEGSTVLSPHRGGGIGLEAVEQARWQGLARALNAAAASGRVEELLCHPLGEFSLNKGY